eukprot:TRINITY_DN9391_c0_g1_i1.p1 TRINITY_DN9391_c0_g1~~TRINITY_DN9391_c0_g1_i1.p1  ORF type:complete len:521 (+),score=175.50 TRINITY_DN9391_c0_g1_i1:77-1639(+)
MASPKDPAARLRSLRKSVVDGEDGELLCSGIMQDVVARAEEQILLNYFDRTAIPYTVQSICKEMLDLVQFVFVARDAGDVGDGAAESWEADEEPEPCPTDTWARGAVPVRKRAVPDPNEKRTPTPNKREPKRAVAAAAKPTDPVPQTPSDAARTKPAAKAGGRGGARAQAAAAAQAQVAQVQDFYEDDVDGDRNEARRRREMRDASEKQNNALRDIKAGREYTVDSLNGKVIPIKPVDPRRLPTKRLDMKYDLESAPRDGDRRMSVDERARGAPKKAKKEAKGKWNEHVQPEDTHGPMVVGAAASPGVTMREGDQVQKNDLKNPKGRMTKGEYKKMMDQMGFTAQSMDMAPEAVDKKEEPPAPPAAERRGSKHPGGKITGGQPPALSPQQAKPAAGAPVKAAGKKSDGLTQRAGPPPTLKPQAPAPVPALRHAAIQGQLDIAKPRERHTTGYASPERSQRKVTLAHPRFGSPQDANAAAAVSPTSTALSRAKPGIVIAPDLDGNEIAEDFLHGEEDDEFA